MVIYSVHYKFFQFYCMFENVHNKMLRGKYHHLTLKKYSNSLINVFVVVWLFAFRVDLFNSESKCSLHVTFG